MQLQPGKTYCDCTVGGGGHVLYMVQTSPRSRFIGIDWDPEAIAHARTVLKPYEDRVTLIEDNFVNIGLILERCGVDAFDGILFDCGVSYHQVTTPARGFSYEHDGALLMQMSPHNPRLCDVLRSASQDEIKTVLRQYGDVRNYRRIASLLYEKRAECRTTRDIRAIVEHVTPPRFIKKNYRRVFQALRIWVNDELTNLSAGLSAAFDVLRTRGRMVTIAYHSGEDRIIKRYFRDLHAQGRCRVFTKKVVRPSNDEVRGNPRARSARLRACEKCASC